MSVQALSAIPLVELALEHARKPDDGSVWRAIGARVVRWAIQWREDADRRFILERCRSIERRTRSVVDKAVWFRGAAAALDGVAGAIDPEFKINDQLRDIEVGMLDTRAGLLELADKLQAMGNADAEKAVRAAVAAYSDYYEALRNFRGAMQAHDADAEACAIAAGGVALSIDELQSDQV